MRLSSPLSTLLLMATGIVLTSEIALANDIYIGQTAAGAGNGQDCGDARAYMFFNSGSNWGTGAIQIGPGSTVHICGAITGGAGSTALTFQGSGASGSPITLLFEPGAMLQAPYWAKSANGVGCGGAISLCSRSYIVLDGGTNGVIANTANGTNLANHQDSTGIDAYNCNNCAVRNLIIQNIYIEVAPDQGDIDQTQVRAISFTGSNWTINNNVIHDCGWCLFQSFQNGDTNTAIFNNNLFNFDHGWMLATSGNYSFSNAYFYNNSLHDTANWDGPGCPAHHDGIHMFGTSGSAISGIYVSNNYFYGGWGTCPTGFVFAESGNISNTYWWNNVFLVQNSPIVNTNGWVGIFQGQSGNTHFINNTVIGPNNSDNTLCVGVKTSNALLVENNLISNCGDPIELDTSAPMTVDYNFYGTTCGNYGNCFILNDSFTGSLQKWQVACVCDSHSVQNSSPLVNADGSLQNAFPATGVGANLISLAAGHFATLSSDTTRGMTRTASLRPVSGPWIPGAYGLAVTGVVGPTPPTGLVATPQ